MEKNFLEKLEQITNEAQEAIRVLMMEKKQVTLFTKCGEDNGEDWTKDIYDEIPDFPFFDTHGFVGYAAIQVVELEGNAIIVSGILKNDCYPMAVKVNVFEMDAYSSVALADYLQTLMSVNK